MKRSLVLGAAIFSMALLTIHEASAQRGWGGGGARMGGGGFGGGGMRMGGPGFRGGAIGARGVGFRGGLGVYRTAGVRGGYVGGARWAGVRHGGFYGQRWYGNRWRGWGWGFPIAGLGYYAGGYGYDNGCTAWDGYQWVNVCYAGYGGYGYW